MNCFLVIIIGQDQPNPCIDTKPDYSIYSTELLHEHFSSNFPFLVIFIKVSMKNELKIQVEFVYNFCPKH